ncbi:AP-1-like transcription factor [Fusarium falciforme]|nr:AP-1-like transcription factor [Fusarium falciforme]
MSSVPCAASYSSFLQEPYDALPSYLNDHFQAFNDTSHGINGSPHQAMASASGPPTSPSQIVFAPLARQVQRLQPERHRSGSSGEKPVPPTDEPTPIRGGSQDDDNLAHARSRKRAQNRAAQRAFRERKEDYVKDLKAKIGQLEAAQQQVSRENERLRRDLQKMSTENAILRATSHISRGSLSTELVDGLMRFNSEGFYSNVVRNHTNKSSSYRVITSIDGESLLAADATWDFIIGHRLFKKGLVNVEDVSNLLKHCARYDGQVPVFSERAIASAIEQAVARGTDDLI